MAKKQVVENRYGCPGAIWKKFTTEQKIAYNNIRSIGRMEYMSHPTAKISVVEWQTISHNFACLGAWELKPIK